MEQLGQIDISYDAGYASSYPALEQPEGMLAPGSRNYKVLGPGELRPFKGLTSIGTGSRLMVQVKSGHGGLSDYEKSTTVASINIGTATLTTSGGFFAPSDVGKVVDILRAGAVGAVFSPTIQSYTSPTQVTVNANAGATVANTIVVIRGAVIQGAGSLFSYISNSLGFIGAGQLVLNGTPLPYVASSSLQFLLSRNASYFDVNSGPYVAGLGQPSAPNVAVLTVAGVGITPVLEGAVAVKVARKRTATGAVSIASTSSAVLICPKGSSIRCTFSSAAVGQNYWVIFVTQQGFGGIGPYFFLMEVSEATVAAGVVDGVARSIELTWQDGDLSPLTAFIDDYPPPAGTHALSIENVIVVGGCYADSSSAPSSTATGTCMAVSEPNKPESFNPENLLYLPEPLVHVLGRPTDSYGYVFCRNWSGALQYIGPTVTGPACALQTLWADVGIAAPHNVCQVEGVIFAYVAKGGAVTIGQLGQPDNAFAIPVRRNMQDWDPASVVVSHNLDTQQVVYSNGSVSLAYNLQSGLWSPPVYLSDFAAGSALSAVYSRGGMQLTLNNNNVHTLYTYDQGAGSSTTAISRWETGNARNLAKTIDDVADSLECDNTNRVYVSLHRNVRRLHVIDAVINNGSSSLTSASAKWSQKDKGHFVLVHNAGVAGEPLFAKIGTVTSAVQVELVDQSTNLPLAASHSVNGVYCLIAHKVFVRDPTETGKQHFRPKRDRNLRDCYSFALGVTMRTSGGDAQSFGAHVTYHQDQYSGGVTS